jgi:hypothetical protein
LAIGRPVPYRRVVASKTLLPEQDKLLCELADAYNEAGDRPQIRVGPEGRTGARVWIWGRPRRQLKGNRKLEDFAELRANGDSVRSRKTRQARTTPSRRQG